MRCAPSRARCCWSPTTGRCSTRWARARWRSRTASCVSHQGGWADYVRARDERRAQERPPRATKANGAAERRRERAAVREKRAGPSKNAVRDREKLEREIEAAEAALAALEQELADPSAWAGPGRSQRAAERHERAKRTVDELYARWESAVG